MEQKRIAPTTGVVHDDVNDDILCAKLHLVDLAGSERAKRTGADGMRFREGNQKLPSVEGKKISLVHFLWLIIFYVFVHFSNFKCYVFMFFLCV